jgi:hypothetical protein
MDYVVQNLRVNQILSGSFILCPSCESFTKERETEIKIKKNGFCIFAQHLERNVVICNKVIYEFGRQSG